MTLVLMPESKNLGTYSCQLSFAESATADSFGTRGKEKRKFEFPKTLRISNCFKVANIESFSNEDPRNNQIGIIDHFFDKSNLPSVIF